LDAILQLTPRGEIAFPIGGHLEDGFSGSTPAAIEGVFSMFKRGMHGVYQHCSEKHLHRYLAEFDFRYNHRIKLGFSDSMRADIALS
jgi:hypothetical protein